MSPPNANTGKRKAGFNLAEEERRAKTFFAILGQKKRRGKEQQSEEDSFRKLCRSIQSEVWDDMEGLTKSLAANENHLLTLRQPTGANSGSKKKKAEETMQPPEPPEVWGCSEKLAEEEEDSGNTEDAQTQIKRLSQEAILLSEAARIIRGKARQLALRRQETQQQNPEKPQGGKR